MIKLYQIDEKNRETARAKRGRKLIESDYAAESRREYISDHKVAINHDVTGTHKHWPSSPRTVHWPRNTRANVRRWKSLDPAWSGREARRFHCNFRCNRHRRYRDRRAPPQPENEQRVRVVYIRAWARVDERGISLIAILRALAIWRACILAAISGINFSCS